MYHTLYEQRLPLRLSVNRRAGPPSHTLAHRPSLTLTHLRPFHHSPHLLRIHLWPLASAAEMVPTSVSFLGNTAHERESTLNITIGLSLSHLPRLISPPAISLSFAACSRLQSFVLPSAS